MEAARLAFDRLKRQISAAILGKEEAVDLLMAALLAQGHVLIEDLPGLGKTTLARALAKSLHAGFTRIQFTPDLLPADILGTAVYHQASGEFSWRSGPIFANVVLADEINRATPRTQSALLEAMNEGSVSADGVTRALPRPFIVIATQNPREHAGTYPLPESQLDRFMLRFSLGYPTRDTERAILDAFVAADPLERVEPVLSLEDVTLAQARAREVTVDEAIKEYVLEIVEETRRHPRLLWGVSPRGAIALIRCAQALAMLRGRGYIIPDDIKYLAKPVFAHRILEKIQLDGKARANGAGHDSVLSSILEKVPVPV